MLLVISHSLHKVTYTFLMNSTKSCVWGQELGGHIFVRTRNENAFLEEEREGKRIRSVLTPTETQRLPR